MIDQKVARFYNICNSVIFAFSCDQVWTVKAKCDHGDFSTKSKGPADLETAVNKLLIKFKEAHTH